MSPLCDPGCLSVLLWSILPFSYSLGLAAITICSGYSKLGKQKIIWHRTWPTASDRNRHCFFSAKVATDLEHGDAQTEGNTETGTDRDKSAWEALAGGKDFLSPNNLIVARDWV